MPDTPSPTMLLAKALKALLECAELNMDDLEPETVEAIASAEEALQAAGVDED